MSIKIPGQSISTKQVEIDSATASRLAELTEGYRAWMGRECSQAEYLSWLVCREHWDVFVKANSGTAPRNR